MTGPRDRRDADQDAEQRPDEPTTV